MKRACMEANGMISVVKIAS
ncbi:MAG: hypothetical protein M3541_08700 [Acidobacteriota bacterium]|nr:hypothetical protein [Acidobacteriota bacterium]